MQKKLILLICLILLATFALAMSPDEAITFASKTNNYLLDGEAAALQEPKVMIKSGSDSYWVVTALQDNTPTAYIPISNSQKKLESGAITIRKLIETKIVTTKSYQLKQSQYGLNWPFSHTTRDAFNDYANEFSDMQPGLIAVKTTLDEANSAEATKLVLKVEDTQDLVDEIAQKSSEISGIVEEARIYEESYLANPDTNQTQKYKDYFTKYFLEVDEFKQEFQTLDSKLTELKQGIAALPTDDIDQTTKDKMIANLKLPTVTGRLSSFFTTTSQLKTAIDSIFPSSSTIEGLALNLSTRVTRNETWQIIYGPNSKISKVNENFNSLSEAVESILDDKYVELWADQTSVESLKSNWSQTQTRFNNREYDKAKAFAQKAEKNVLDILEAGVPAQENIISQDLMTQVIILLAIALIIFYVVDKFYLKKKKGKKDEEENYAQP